ncbi:hypothetical protein RFI_04785 [Reticulomyxa filosa]|uniref:RING-type domain-containing protein n=1 Tax=Reticulomyxa filosa TaxID=46433 RepID=X6P293_RETFI|nr:hypothetical protein RFI_04785 [Reticulomyxa filosa]|eukprot:ETO32331.1 hypothetical protein RFI_04785 [Reticulomyxa filosa]
MPPKINVDHSVDPNIQIPTRQEMFDKLVELLSKDENSIGKDKKEQEMFFDFCAPFIVAGVCTVRQSLMTSLLASFFTRAITLSEKVDQLERNVSRIRNQIENEKNAPNRNHYETLLSVLPSTLTSGMDELVAEEQLQKRQLKVLLRDKDLIENILLVLVERQIEDKDNNKSVNKKELIQKSKQAKVYKVELYLHKCDENHYAVVDAYLSHPTMCSEVFDYLHNLYQDYCDDKAYVRLFFCYLLLRSESKRIAASNKSKPTQMPMIQDVMLKRLDSLVNVDPIRTAILIFTLMPSNYSDAIAALDNFKQQQYSLMKAISNALSKLQEEQLLASGKSFKLTFITINNNNNNNNSNNNNNNNIYYYYYYYYIQTYVYVYKYERFLRQLLKQHKIEFDMKHHELFIQLLCKFDKNSVLDYLQVNTDKYTLVNAQRSCESEKVLHACAYLQERSGDSQAALGLNTFVSLLVYFCVCVCVGGGGQISSHGRAASSMGLMTLSQKIDDASAAIEQLNLAIGLCRRQTLKDQAGESAEALWDRLLDECLSIQQDIAKKVTSKHYQENFSRKVRENMKTIGSEFVGRILEAMMGMKINLSKMFMKVVEKGNSKEYLHYRDTVDVMLSTYQYETNMLKTAVHLFGRGAFLEFEKFVNSSRHAFKAPDDFCKICEAKLVDIPLIINDMVTDKPIRKPYAKIFACGHAIHSFCLVRAAFLSLVYVCTFTHIYIMCVNKAIARAQELRRAGQSENKAANSVSVTSEEKVWKLNLMQQYEKRKKGDIALLNLKPHTRDRHQPLSFQLSIIFNLTILALTLFIPFEKKITTT